MMFLFLLSFAFTHAVRVKHPELPEVVWKDEGPTVSPDEIKYQMERACLRKQNLSEEEANRIVDKHAARGKLSYFYKCQFCDSFHLTSKRPMPEKHFRVQVV